MHSLRRTFRPKYATQRYCSRQCGSRWDRAGIPRPDARKVDRPPYPQLLREVRALGFSATGRRYGVSDNAIRKWIRAYESETEPASSGPREPKPGALGSVSGRAQLEPGRGRGPGARRTRPRRSSTPSSTRRSPPSGGTGRRASAARRCSSPTGRCGWGACGRPSRRSTSSATRGSRCTAGRGTRRVDGGRQGRGRVEEITDAERKAAISGEESPPGRRICFGWTSQSSSSPASATRPITSSSSPGTRAAA